MRNSVNIRSAALLFALLAASTSRIDAQSSPAAARYEVLREQEVRVLMSAAATPDDFRVVVNRYWSFVRRYPSSGYTDNALWQAANLSWESFSRFGEERDRSRAAQLFEWLRDQYPRSRYVAGASTGLDQLGSTIQSAGMALETALAPATGADETIVRAVNRQVLPDLVRVTVELDREVVFSQERLEKPARVFFDLKGAKPVPALADATLRYDSDVVRHIRLGRQPNNTTRVVLDLANVARYSVFTLYNPYRIVIDMEREGTPVAPIPSAPLVLAAAKPPVATVPVRPPTAAVSPIPSSAPAVPLPSAPPLRARTVTLLPSPVIPVSRSTPIPVQTPVDAAFVDTETPGTRAAADKAASGKPLMPSANSTGKFSVARQLGLGVSRIVIDAGHGGHDPGASAFGVAEAELVLDVALRLEKLLQKQGIEVVLTRRTDVFVPLDERTEMANREEADLFLSIHANASANAAARGIETYFLNFALNPQAEAVAARENAASGKTMNSLTGIIKAITLNSKLNESRDLAASIQRAMVRGLRPGNGGVKDLGVKQAPFMVLIGASMPSALAEISFLTNRQEAKLLKTPNYRQKIADALLAGILRYQQSLKKVQTAALQKSGGTP
jgi:N-acetylmuramoyl-L-alanine amidase